MDFEIGQNKLRAAEVGFLIVISFVLIAVTAEPEKAKAECYTTVETCQGLDAAGCVGQEKVKTKFVSKDKCSVVENITRECRTLRKAICGSEKINSTEWSEKAETFGKNCKTWKEQYDLNYSLSCS